MDASRLIGMILEAGERAKSILPHYIGMPYTVTTVNALDHEVCMSIEALNCELRDELGIELYVDIIPTITDTTVQGYVKVRKYMENPQEEKGRRQESIWVEQSGVGKKGRLKRLKQLLTISQRSS